MEVHWAHAKFLLETLVMKAYGLDKNGMDLSFTYGEVILEGSKDEAKFRRKMEEREAQPMAGWHTDMSRSLEDILFTKYLAECRREPASKVKKLTLIQCSPQAVQKAWPGLAWVPGRGHPQAW